jgi:hypothetical protein
MKFIVHPTEKGTVAELSGQIILNDTEDMVDVLGNADYQGARKIIVHSSQLNPDFFELRSGIAGDMLQKISNYRMSLAVVGDFANVESKSLRDFIFESNKRGQVCFVDSLEEALQRLSK